jgi:Flp pilus assembly pilin Flp
MLRALYEEESGTTAIEYALIGCLVSAFIIVGCQNLRAMVQVLYAISSGLIDAI